MWITDKSWKRFQSTHPQGVRPGWFSLQTSCIDFNPRTHKGCDFMHFFNAFKRKHISIHAPTRGATPFGCANCGNNNISIHAPTRGATIVYDLSGAELGISIHAPTRGATPWHGFIRGPFSFQSTHPQGVRRTCLQGNAAGHKISIHAPTRGATQASQKSIHTSQFQSTHPQGVRPTSSAAVRTPGNFNPRTHKGCDQHLRKKSAHVFDFNPRTHKGCDGK